MTDTASPFNPDRQLRRMMTQETRHDIVQALKGSGGGMTRDELLAVIDATEENLSVALALLSDNGIISESSEGECMLEL